MNPHDEIKYSESGCDHCKTTHCIPTATLKEIKELRIELDSLKGLLQRNHERMKLINGYDDNCIVHHPEKCPNHGLMKETELALSTKSHNKSTDIPLSVPPLKELNLTCPHCHNMIHIPLRPELEGEPFGYDIGKIGKKKSHKKSSKDYK